MTNRIKHIAIILVVLFSIQSCDEYLEILPDGQESSENFFNSQDDYEAALIGVYDILSTTYLHNILGEIASDNSLCGGENATDVLDWQQIDDMIHTPDNSALRTIFQQMYAGISRKPELLAENLFLRSYYYFELVKFFGDVPMYLDGRISIDETQTIDRTPKEQVYAQLEQDLLTAIQNLPWQQAQEGRVTKGAALALLGKIYLYQDKFNESATTLNQVINSGEYQLVQNFGSIFLNGNENNSEAVFEVQYFGGEGGGFDCFQCVEGNIAVGFMGPRFTGLPDTYAPFAGGFSFNVPIQATVDLYEAGDMRLAATVFDINDFVVNNPGVTFNLGNEHTGYFNMKYIPYAEANLQDQNLTHSNNYRAIRYADVLLMAAEANIRATAPVRDPQPLLDMIRDRAFGDEDNRIPATLENVLLERRLELVGEGHRFFDQVRNGQTNTIPGFTINKNELFPIPRIEIELAGNRWPQNQGY